MESEPRFYFTIHPGDMIKERILDGAHIMLVASAHWDDRRRRFKVRRPPDNVASICIDSGGFTAAQRWGHYPWTVAQYVEFIRKTSLGIKLDFCAILDYACEQGVKRSVYRTNKQRIKATIRNEAACFETAPELPWLPVLQGDTLEQRAFDLELRRRVGMLPEKYAGIGSVCGRGIETAKVIVKFYAARLLDVKFHAFGIHIQALDDALVFSALQSWDSYSWNWGRGQKDVDRPPEYYHQSGERWSEYTHRLASLYWNNTIKLRLKKEQCHARQLMMDGFI